MTARVALVCEGPTDVPVLEAVLRAVLGNDIVTSLLQPDETRDALRSAAGWTEVRRWCEARGRSLQWVLAQFDILVVHLDGDRRSINHVNTTSQLCDTIKGWLGPGATEPKLIIVIPSQASETWLRATYRPVTPQTEDENDPTRRMVGEGRLKADQDGEPKKELAVYRTLAEGLRSKLPLLRTNLPELERFSRKIERFRPA